MEGREKYGGYRLSSHARARMVERGLTEVEVLKVLDDPATVEQADSPGLIRYRSHLAGRSICVTVDAFTDIVVTVVAPRLSDAKSLYGWFSLGSGVEVKR